MQTTRFGKIGVSRRFGKIVEEVRTMPVRECSSFSSVVSHPPAARSRYALLGERPSIHPRCAAAAVLVLLFSGWAALALDPSKAITQYTHRVWQTQDGLPQNSVSAMVQTHDGYVWLGTEEGLVRFDGAEFKVFDKTTFPALPDNCIRALLVDREGGLWVATRKGLLRLSAQEVKAYHTADGLPADYVVTVIEDADGTIWALPNGGGLARFTGRGFEAYGRKHGLPDRVMTMHAPDRGGVMLATADADLLWLVEDRVEVQPWDDGAAKATVFAMCDDGAGGLWLGTSKGLMQWTHGRISPGPGASSVAGVRVETLCLDRHGNLWIGTDAGIVRITAGLASIFSAQDGLSVNNVSSLLEDREGNLWVGTTGGGLNQLSDGRFRTYTSREGLNGDSVYSLLEDHAGVIWVGTEGGGLNRLEDGLFAPFGSGVGPFQVGVSALAEDGQGTLWVGTWRGLYRLRGGKVSPTPLGPIGQRGYVRAIYPSRDGALWVSMFGIGLVCVKDNTVRVFTTKDGLSNTHIEAIHEDALGRLWIATDGGGLNCYSNGRFNTYTTDDGLSSNVLNSFYEDAHGGLWIATSGGGIALYAEGRFRSCTTKQGLYHDDIFSIVPDGMGNLWMSCNKGVFRAAISELQAALAGHGRSVTCVPYGVKDGMKSAECNLYGHPAAIRTRSGELWFATIKGAVRIDPRAVQPSRILPPVFVEAVAVDGEPMNAGGGVELPPGHQRLEIHYTGLGFSAPECVRFKYTLDGFDRGWVDAHARRTAYYTNLQPGNYNFRVIACNPDGVWNQAGASLAIHVPPRFYQALWFQILWVTGLAIAVVGIHRLRLRSLRARERELTRRVEEGLASIKILRGLLPICAWCRRVRDDQGYWAQLEQYVREHSEAQFTHGICPECVEKHFPEIAQGKQRGSPGGPEFR